jgi:hypothetical protein
LAEIENDWSHDDLVTAHVLQDALDAALAKDRDR